MTAINKRRPVIAAIDGGLYYHYQSVYKPPFDHYFEDVIYLRDVARTELCHFDVLFILCRTNPEYLLPLSEQFQEFMDFGSTLVVMGETFPNQWLPHIHFKPMQTNFWWWLEDEADLGVRISDSNHSIAKYITKEAATWHLHGTFSPLQSGQKSLIETNEGECLLFEDVETYSPGRLIATTLDPFYHHGSHFMPATTQFLDRFLRWLSQPI